MDSRSYYEKHLATQEYLNSRKDRAELIANILSKELSEKNRVLDLGSGSGIIKLHLEKQFAKPILGIELTEEVIVVKDNTCIGDVTCLPIKDKSVDLVMCNHLYEHISGQDKFAKELSRILVLDGIVYLTVGNKFQIMEPHYRLPFLSWLPLPLANWYLRISSRGKDYSEINFPTFGKLKGNFENAGLTLRDITLDVILAHSKRLRKKTHKVAFWFLKRMPENFRNLLIDILSPQWFVLITNGRR